MELTDNQFTPYARGQAAIAIDAHLEALRSTSMHEHTRGRVDGIFWVSELLGISLDTPRVDPNLAVTTEEPA